jgi:hypothetical protein
MILTLLLNEIKSRFRAKLWQRGLAINIILFFVAAYFILVAIGLGILMPQILEEAHPDLATLQAMNQYIGYYLVADLSIRFFLQAFPLMSIQSYLLLPIKRSKLYHLLLIRSIPDFFNILPLFILVPFAIVHLFPNYSAAIAWSWLVLMMLFIGINHFLAFYLKRSVTVKPWLTLVVILAVATLYLIDSQGWIPLSDSFAQIIDAVMSRPLLLLAPLGLLAGVYTLMLSRLRKYAYLDALVSTKKREASTQHFRILDRFGKIGDVIQMDLKLIWRNKRPRTMLTMSVFFVIYPLIFHGEILSQLGFIIFIGVLVIGMMMVNYGQFMLSWESSFFDLLMARNWSIRDYYEAKYFFFMIANVIMLVLTSVYGFLNINFPLIFFAVALFNIGINSILLMYFSTFNTKRIEPNKGAFFNYEGVNVNQFVMILPILLMPLLIYWPFAWLGFKWWGIGAIALVGILGILFRPMLLDFVSREFTKRKYKIVTGFREK